MFRPIVYVVGWLLALGIAIVASAVSGALSLVPFVGFVGVAVVSFYTTVVAVRLYAASYAGAVFVEDGERSEASPRQPAA